MRITNNMMLHNTSANINGNKGGVLDLNSQMSSQKKIQRPSENPVIAIRALRLRTSLSKINQYYEKNIPDANAWLESTETALKNMNIIITDIKKECVNGTNDTLNQDDRNAILKGLTALKSQLYSEGNADNAGRTVFTGFKTNSKLTFLEDEANTTYRIAQKFNYRDIDEFTYYNGSVNVPTTVAEVQATDNIGAIGKSSYNRLRLAYDKLGDLDKLTYTIDGAETNATVTVYETEDEWAAASSNGEKVAQADEIVYIKNVGDVIFGNEIAETLKSGRASIEVDYQKKGFEKGELRPEYYYNCTDVTDIAHPIPYAKYDENGNKIYEDINFTVALNQTLKINLQADEIFDMSIYQDVVELANAVSGAINAHDKVSRIKAMQTQSQFAEMEDELKKWLEAAKKEADYADSRMSELYSAGIGKFDKYLEDINKAYTEAGTRGSQLEMTENRISNQQLTIDELKSTNEDKDLSDIIMEYTAAYNAYTASLMSASKVNKQTLLNYI